MIHLERTCAYVVKRETGKRLIVCVRLCRGREKERVIVGQRE